MKISFSWLKEHLRTDKTASEVATILTGAGLEVGAIESTGVAIPKVVAARILESVQHPNADRLSVCKVDDGSGTPRQIVCGAKNYKVGDKVPLAQPGAVMPGDFKIKVGKLRGVESEGMLCSSKELGLGEGADGLLILPPDTIVGTPLAELFPAEEVFEIEITPNRPDWLAHRRVAIEAAAFGAGELKADVLFGWPTKRVDSLVATIEVSEVASYYTIRRIDGVKVGPSPEWLRKRLESVGLRSINNIVDVTNFVMYDVGQPLHAFDADTIKGALRVRFAHQGESFTALDGKKYSLTSEDPVIADDKGVQAIAGIIGGLESAVTEKTSSIILESAVFRSAIIRRSSRRLGISTDSSYRFERVSNSVNAIFSSARATELITGEKGGADEAIGGGTAESHVIVAGTGTNPLIVPLNNNRLRSLLGVELDDESIAGLLERIGMKRTPRGWKIHFLRRNDVRREIDLIEEVARLHGIGNITSRVQGIPSHSSDADRAYDFALGLRRRLSGMGFHEARCGTLTGSRNQTDYSPAPVVMVRNPMGEEHSTLRGSLIPGLLDAVARNLRHGAEAVRLFEIGRVYSQEQPEESSRLGLVMTGRLFPSNWRGEGSRPVDLFDLKGVLGTLGGCTGVFNFRATTHRRLARTLELLIGGKPAGLLGMLSLSDTRELVVGGHQGSILVAEIDLDALQESLDPSFKSSKNFGAPPKFPSVRRDLSLQLGTSIPYSAVEEAVLGAGEELLAGITPFDVFSDPMGEKVQRGKKSLAITLTFQRTDRTLTTEEVTEALGRIVTRLRDKAGAEIRG